MKTIQNNIWEMKKNISKDPCISIGNKMFKLCQDEKLAIILCPDQYKLLNERSEVMAVYKRNSSLTFEFSVLKNDSL